MGKWLPGRASLGLKRLPIERNLLTPSAWQYSTVGVLCPDSSPYTSIKEKDSIVRKALDWLRGAGQSLSSQLLTLWLPDLGQDTC